MYRASSTDAARSCGERKGSSVLGLCECECESGEGMSVEGGKLLYLIRDTSVQVEISRRSIELPTDAEGKIHTLSVWQGRWSIDPSLKLRKGFFSKAG